MANYNTFLVVDCYTRKSVLVTSSARKAKEHLAKGVRVEVWNNNQKIETIYSPGKKNCNKNPLGSYIEAEKEYIGKRQMQAERRNRMRKQKHRAVYDR